MVRDEIDSKDSAAEKLEDQKRKVIPGFLLLQCVLHPSHVCVPCSQAANEKKREKAKARKTVKDLAPRGEDAKASDLDLVTDVEEIQTMDSERMAKQLLEEEERARVGKRAKADKKGKK